MPGEPPLDEPLGAERVRVGIQILATMDQVTARAEHDAGGIFAAAGDEGLFGQAHDEGKDRAQPQRLADRRVEVRSASS